MQNVTYKFYEDISSTVIMFCGVIYFNIHALRGVVSNLKNFQNVSFSEKKEIYWHV